MHNARRSSRGVWPATVENQPARRFDEVHAGVEHFGKRQECFHSFGDASTGDKCLLQLDKPHQARPLGDPIFLMKLFSIT